MDDKPTHRHICSGDIVFWHDALDPGEHEQLPDDHWDSPEMKAHKLQGEINGIKLEAEKRILEFAPIWRQLNAAMNPDTPESVELRNKINDMRNWSNVEEARIRGEFQC